MVGADHLPGMLKDLIVVIICLSFPGDVLMRFMKL